MFGNTALRCRIALLEAKERSNWKQILELADSIADLRAIVDHHVEVRVTPESMKVVHRK